MPEALAVSLLLVASMVLTPFLHHAAAQNLGLAMEAFLMALGASCDFLTPISHQNNFLVMGSDGYRFGDCWRMGLPLSCMVAGLGAWLIVKVWPLH